MVLPSFLINNDYDNTLWYNVLQDNINIIVELKNKHPEFISKFEARGSTLKHFLKNNTIQIVVSITDLEKKYLLESSLTIFRMSYPDCRVRNPKGLILVKFCIIMVCNFRITYNKYEEGTFL